MKNRTHYLFFIMLFLGLTTVFAQKTLSNAIVKYDMDTTKSTPETGEMTIHMDMDYYILDTEFKMTMDMNMMGMGMHIETSIDTKTKSGVILMNAMGQKMGAKITPADYEKMQEENKGLLSGDVELISGTETVLGYKCNKAKVITNEGQEMLVYYTKTIKPLTIPGADKIFVEGIDGMPIKYEMEIQGSAIAVTLESLTEGSVKVGDFSYEIPEGYTELTYQQLSQMGQGM